MQGWISYCFKFGIFVISPPKHLRLLLFAQILHIMKNLKQLRIQPVKIGQYFSKKIVVFVDEFGICETGTLIK